MVKSYEKLEKKPLAYFMNSLLGQNLSDRYVAKLVLRSLKILKNGMYEPKSREQAKQADQKWPKKVGRH